VILGLTRVSRSRLGSRLFTWFFVFVYLVIVIQLIWSILQGLTGICRGRGLP